MREVLCRYPRETGSPAVLYLREFPLFAIIRSNLWIFGHM